MADVLILRYLPLDYPPDERGHRALAVFDCRTRGILLYGVRLMRHARGFLFLRSPIIETGRRSTTGAHVADDALATEIVAAAHARGVVELGPKMPPLLASGPRPPRREDREGQEPARKHRGRRARS